MADGKFGGSIGDISSILHNQGVADLSWLAVDETEYRAAEALPKQNLDIIPELQRALYDDDDGVPTLIPLKPHTIVNRNPLDFPPNVGPLDSNAPIRNRVAQYVMSGLPEIKIKSFLSQEFHKDHISAASDSINEVLFESGLLGNVYVNSAHFPACASSSKTQKFIKTKSSKHALILAKDQCSNCVHASTGNCSALGNRRLVNEVKYNSSLAAQHAPRLASEGRPIDPSGNSDWRSRIQSAYMSSPAKENIYTGLHTQNKNSSALLKKRGLKDLLSSPVPVLSSDYVKYARRMMDGFDDRVSIVSSSDAQSKVLTSQYGLLGHSWIDIDALGGCNFAVKYASGELPPEYFVRRSSFCTNCNGEDGGCCSQISSVSTIVDDIPVLGELSVLRSLDRMTLKGHISSEQASQYKSRVASSKIEDYSKLISQSNLFEPVAQKAETGIYQGHVYKRASSVSTVQTYVDPSKVRSFISHLLNSGLTGMDLNARIASVWSNKDLESVHDTVSSLMEMDGIQGKIYVDPTAYSDYGRGCSQGPSSLRDTETPFVLASSKCTGCMLQTASGWCSKYSKGLIRSVPKQVLSSLRTNKTAAKIRSARSLPVLNPNIEYDVNKPSLDIDIPSSPSGIEIGISSKVID